MALGALGFSAAALACGIGQQWQQMFRILEVAGAGTVGEPVAERLAGRHGYGHGLEIGNRCE